jgi:hypothetical protein
MSDDEERKDEDIPEDFTTEREEKIELKVGTKRRMTADRITMYDKCVIPVGKKSSKKRSARKRRKQPIRKTSRKSRKK